eukprot:TRINITY_DN10044_c0_g1_i2.p1 TRINITY_DN10044_c0_g1~~TRINITY_DN10044_c0_g1_i2.p1  ORF type:complete len:135 (+),score=6.24 TRINITY_DN10044_c0_g1_i2:65-469(+)
MIRRISSAPRFRFRRYSSSNSNEVKRPDILKLPGRRRFGKEGVEGFIEQKADPYCQIQSSMLPTTNDDHTRRTRVMFPAIFFLICLGLYLCPLYLTAVLSLMSTPDVIRDVDTIVVERRSRRRDILGCKNEEST